MHYAILLIATTFLEHVSSLPHTRWRPGVPGDYPENDFMDGQWDEFRRNRYVDLREMSEYDAYQECYMKEMAKNTHVSWEKRHARALRDCNVPSDHPIRQTIKTSPFRPLLMKKGRKSGKGSKKKKKKDEAAKEQDESSPQDQKVKQQNKQQLGLEDRNSLVDFLVERAGLPLAAVAQQGFDRLQYLARQVAQVQHHQAWSSYRPPVSVWPTPHPI